MADDYGAGYPMDERLVLSQAQIRVWANPTRQIILGLLGQRAATISQLAETIGKPKGSIGHHVQSLEQAGLIQVVRTRKVRAMTEKYYGRVAWIFQVAEPEASGLPDWLKSSLRQLATSESRGFPPITGFYHAQMPRAVAVAFARRVEALAEEFGHKPAAGEEVYEFVSAVFLNEWPGLPPEKIDDTETMDPP
jgi:DNA-binding transcriptional ArsR family regulator